MRRRDERGAAAVEFVILVPALILMLGLIVAAGRIAVARINVQQWAGSAARTASIARDPGTARAQAQEVVRADAAASGIQCRGAPALDLDLAAFATPAGTPGSVHTTVRCALPLGDLVPGLPGTIQIDGEGSSPLDRYRGRR